MAATKARDFLDKELFVNRHIVTFRSLSRRLGIHVNDAKTELQRYYDAVRDTDTPAVATYLVSGDVPALVANPQPSSDSMDLDLAFEEDRETADVVQRSKVLLVDARALEDVKAQFSRISSVHVYSLSPSRLADPGLVCVPTADVYEADVRGGPSSFATVGKLTGTHVKLRSGVVRKAVASSSRTTLDVPTRATPKAAVEVKAVQQTRIKLETREPTKLHVKAEPEEKARPSGKLDWSKAEPKEKAKPSGKVDKSKAEPKEKAKPLGKLDWSKAKTKEKEGTGEEEKPKTTVDAFAGKKLERELTRLQGSSTGDAQKRGMKRKPRIDDDSEPESEPSVIVKTKPSTTTTKASIKKEVVDSDEEDESDGHVRKLGLRRTQRKGAVTSDSEMSLRAMMDIDDDQVDRVSRVGKVRPQPEEEEESTESEKAATAPPVTSEGEGEESDDAPIVPKKKRNPRKVAPVGRNGLRKRRVVKSRTTTDAKGYMQTEDYSSYESVEEEEAPKPKGKGKEVERKGSKVEETKPKVKEESGAKPKAKAASKRGGTVKHGGGLLNFFGPDKGKK